MFNVIYILLLALMPMKHPIHVSMTNIEYNKTEKAYNVIIKVFTDDFEANILQLYKVNLNTSKENEFANYNKIASEYVNKYFKINLDDKNYSLKFLSKKTNFEATWLSFKLSDVKATAKNAEIINNIMNQFYRDQTNLVIFTKEEFQQAFNMNYTDTLVKFNLN